jgi:hypothetical protein
VDRRLIKYKFEPMDLANMRQNGVRSLEVMCHGCRHEVILNVDQYPEDLWYGSSDRAWSAPNAVWLVPTLAELERAEEVMLGKAMIGLR